MAALLPDPFAQYSDAGIAPQLSARWGERFGAVGGGLSGRFDGVSRENSRGAGVWGENSKMAGDLNWPMGSESESATVREAVDGSDAWGDEEPTATATIDDGDALSDDDGATPLHAPLNLRFDSRVLQDDFDNDVDDDNDDDSSIAAPPRKAAPPSRYAPPPVVRSDSATEPKPDPAKIQNSNLWGGATQGPQQNPPQVDASASRALSVTPPRPLRAVRPGFTLGDGQVLRAGGGGVAAAALASVSVGGNLVTARDSPAAGLSRGNPPPVSAVLSQLSIIDVPSFDGAFPTDQGGERQAPARVAAVSSVIDIPDLLSAPLRPPSPPPSPPPLSSAASPDSPLPPPQAATQRKTVSFADDAPKFGIGIVFKRLTDGNFYIKRLLEGEPADACGKLRPGDCVLAIDGVPLRDKALTELSPLVLGPPLSKIQISVRSTDGAVFSLPLTRSDRHAPSIASSSDGEGINPPPPPPPASRKRVGVGITFKKSRLGYFAVKRLTPDGPAAMSGQIAADDVVVAIDGVAVGGVSNSELSELVLGAVGTRLVLTVRTGGGAPRDVILTRAPKGVSAEMSTIDYSQSMEMGGGGDDGDGESQRESNVRVVAAPAGVTGGGEGLRVPATVIKETPPVKSERTKATLTWRDDPPSPGEGDTSDAASDFASEGAGATEGSDASDSDALRAMVGIGATFKRTPSGSFIVRRLMSDGPAQRSGAVAIGDAILQVHPFRSSPF